jgi:hypothetical protein
MARRRISRQRSRPRGRRRERRTGRSRRLRHAVQRLEALLETARGRAARDFDHRPDEQLEPRVLSVANQGPLFENLALRDYEFLLALPFAAGGDILSILLPQSVLGRAQNGHGWFVDEAGRPLLFPDATFDRVLTALEKLDPSLTGPRVRQRRGELVDAVCDWVTGAIMARGEQLALPESGFLGVEFLRDRQVLAEPFLRGMVLAGFMDDYEYRQLAMAHYRLTFGGEPLHIGGGQILVVRPDRLRQTGINDPARVEFTAGELRQLGDLGVIVEAPEGERFCRPEFDQAYFRRRLGEGVSDDLALIWMGAQHGFDAMLGGFLMDAIDTYDKHLWCFVTGGFDGHLARTIQAWYRQRHGQPLVKDEEILQLIRFAAKLNDPPCPLSSSHRRLIQYEEGARLPTLLHHWRFLENKRLDDIRLGYHRLPARDFYTIARARLLAVGQERPMPEFRRS